MLRTCGPVVGELGRGDLPGYLIRDGKKGRSGMTRNRQMRIGAAACLAAVIGALGSGTDRLLRGGSIPATTIPFVCAAALAAVGVNLMRQSSKPQADRIGARTRRWCGHRYRAAAHLPVKHRMT